EELDALEKEGKKEVSNQKRAAWEAYLNPIKKERDEVVNLITAIANESANKAFISPMADALKSNTEPIRKDIVSTAKRVLRMVRLENMAAKNALISWLDNAAKANFDRYNSTLLSEFPSSPM